MGSSLIPQMNELYRSNLDWTNIRISQQNWNLDFTTLNRRERISLLYQQNTIVKSSAVVGITKSHPKSSVLVKPSQHHDGQLFCGMRQGTQMQIPSNFGPKDLKLGPPVGTSLGSKPQVVSGGHLNGGPKP